MLQDMPGCESQGVPGSVRAAKHKQSHPIQYWRAALNKHTHIDPNSKLSVVIILGDQSILNHEIPHTDSHIIGGGHNQIPGVGRKPNPPDSVAMPAKTERGTLKFRTSQTKEG